MQALSIPMFRQMTLPAPRLIALPLVALVLGWAIMTLPRTLAMDGRAALLAMALAVLGWVGTRIPESLVALGAVLVLVLGGVLSEAQLFAALGSELVWLLLAAFVIAAVIRESGLTARLILPLVRLRLGFGVFAMLLTLMIAATAFVLPSTSGRAALLLPVFAALADALPDARLRRPLALIFPTAILLSAGASLIGAGAHLLAVESIRAATGLRLGYVDWAMLGLPFALLASLAGTGLILWLFVPRALLRQPLKPADMPAPDADQRRRQGRIALVLAVVVGFWLGAGLHGIGMATVALIGALVLLTPPFTRRKSKEIFRAVDVELLLYMTATVLMAQAMTATGADRWLAGQALGRLPADLHGSLVAVVALLAVISVAAHLFVTSRSARAAVLIPAVALPLAGLGHDAALLILVAVMGTGFCQTLMASAKPVAIFAGAEGGGFTQGDLLRLALPLAPMVTALLMLFALAVWPAQLAGLRPAQAVPDTVAMPADPSMAAPAEPARPAAMPGAEQPAVVPVMIPVPVIPAEPAVGASRPVPRPKGLGLRAAAPVAKRAAPQTVPPDLRGLQHRVNRALRPAGIRITIR